ncbi:MAG: recombinase RecA [Melioribacteraceae bacterium]|nr:recombinase RecA [Melioribacteraceae bacterium]
MAKDKDKEVKSKEDIQDLDKVMKEINKECGELIKLGGDKENVECLTTGSIALDNAIGVGGFPKGRIVEIYGPEASGKTTIALGAVAAAQQIGIKVAFLDMEHALDPKMAKGIGVQWEKLLFSQPNYGEQCLDIACKLAATGKLGIIVIDSVAALVPKVELDGEMDDVQMGAMAKMMAKGLRKLVPVCQETGTMVIFINQLREKLGVMFGNPETTPGGKALRFAASVRLDVRRKEQIKEGDRVLGNHLRIKVVKNKVAEPHHVAEVDLYFGKGIDNLKDVIESAIELNIIIKKGSSYFEYGEIKAAGKDKLISALNADLAKRKELEDSVRSRAGELKAVIESD